MCVVLERDGERRPSKTNGYPCLQGHSPLPTGSAKDPGPGSLDKVYGGYERGWGTCKQGQSSNIDKESATCVEVVLCSKNSTERTVSGGVMEQVSAQESYPQVERGVLWCVSQITILWVEGLQVE